MNTCRTDSPDYHRTADFDYNEEADSARKRKREIEFWDTFTHGDNLHGDKFEALRLAENIMLMDEDLYKAAIKFIADSIAESMPKTALAKQADKSARKYMNDAIDTMTDDWSEE